MQDLDKLFNIKLSEVDVWTLKKDLTMLTQQVRFGMIVRFLNYNSFKYLLLIQLFN